MDALTAMKQAREAMNDVAYGSPVFGKNVRAALDALDAAIQQAERAEPVAWHVVDADGCLMHAVQWREAAHEHINDAITEHDLAEASTWRVVPVYAAPVATPVHPPVHGWTDADADAARLALELECILTDKDQPMPTLSRWWDSAHEALELHRQRMREVPAAPVTVTEDDLRAMLPKPEHSFYIGNGNKPKSKYTTFSTKQVLAYGRAIVARCGGMK